MNTRVPSVASFYDDLAPHYHLLYSDWERSVAEQGEALASLLSAFGVTVADPILDAACGIGTQTLGLARLGFNMAASDISHMAVERLQQELVQRGLSARTRVDDLRTLAQVQILVGADRRAGNRWPTALAGGDQHAVADHACDALRPLDQSTDNMSVVRIPGDDAPRNHDDLPCPALVG